MKKLIRYLLLAFLFLLPWQTRYIWQYGELNNGYWEYGTFSIYATEILLWIILLLFFIDNHKNFLLKLKEKPPRIFLMLLLSLAFSMALSNNFWVSYNYIFKFLEAMAFFVVLSGVISPLPRGSEEGVAEALTAIDGKPPLPLLGKEWMTSGRNDRLMVALWAGAVLQGALAVSQFLTQNVWVSKWLGMAGQEAGNLGPSVIEFADQRWLRAYGSFGSPNSLGIYLAVLFVLGLVLYLSPSAREGVVGVGADTSASPSSLPLGKREMIRKIILSVGQLFILSGLLVSFSRGAWIAAAVGAAVLFVVVFVIPSLPRRGRGGLPEIEPVNTSATPSSLPLGKGEMTPAKEFGKQIGFALLVVVFWLAIFYPVFAARFNLSNRLEAKSISERNGQYSEALSFIKSNPILGVGPGAYTYALSKKYPTLPAWQYQPIHNIYLLALVEIGLAGFVFLFLLFKRLLTMIIKNNLIYLPVIGSLFAAGLFDHWLWSMYGGILLWWAVFGLGFADANNP